MEALRLEGRPEAFRVEGNYPNPFSGRTTIEYALPEERAVEIVVYDVLGRRVRTVVEAEQEAGRHSATVEARGLTSGTYFYRVRAGQQTETGQLVIVR
jgi:phosphodiesterase/alkaline phosphatase D-like protein